MHERQRKPKHNLFDETEKINGGIGFRRNEDRILELQGTRNCEDL